MSKCFNNNLPRSCKYCVFGRASLFSNEILCNKRGVTNARDYCRNYKYDPLKRIPERIKISDNYDPKDFSL